MADVDHELGAIRFLVEAPLKSRVAMFNNAVNQHQESQKHNPFSASSGGLKVRPSITKDEYGKPVHGSLTEARGQRANMHVFKEMYELCQIIHSEGYTHSKQNPDLRVITFGELFNIYTHISDKVVGLLLRARKYKFVDFEGEMLFQRRDDDVPIFMLMTIKEIKAFVDAKVEEVRRSVSPNPLAATLIQDNCC